MTSLTRSRTLVFHVINRSTGINWDTGVIGYVYSYVSWGGKKRANGDWTTPELTPDAFGARIDREREEWSIDQVTEDVTRGQMTLGTVAGERWKGAVNSGAVAGEGMGM